MIFKKGSDKRGSKPSPKPRRVAPHRHHYVVASTTTMGDGTVWTYSRCSCGNVISRAH
jgi:hypothetical protein